MQVTGCQRLAWRAPTSALTLLECLRLPATVETFSGSAVDLVAILNHGFQAWQGQSRAIAMLLRYLSLPSVLSICEAGFS